MPINARRRSAEIVAPAIARRTYQRHGVIVAGEARIVGSTCGLSKKRYAHGGPWQTLQRSASAPPGLALPVNKARRRPAAISDTPKSSPARGSLKTPAGKPRGDTSVVVPLSFGFGDCDFVEGGIELPPALPEDGADPCGCKNASSPSGPQLPRPLPQHPQDQLLGEYWSSASSSGPQAFFLDYDGTLREIERRPELAVPTQEVIELLQAINARSGLVPHIISGRDASFLETHFGNLKRFTLLAEHGFQIRRPGAKNWELWDNSECPHREREDWKDIVRAEMTAATQSAPGSHIEEKVSSLVWHYREACDDIKAEKAAVGIVERLDGLCRGVNGFECRVSQGHKVVEASHRKVRKGPAMRRICEEKALFGEAFASVLVAGDDASDESMFDIAPQDFLTVKVGQGVTRAKFQVESPHQLRTFLWQLIA